MRLARLNWPPISLAASNSVTRGRAAAATVAQARPAGPAPTTAMRLRRRRSRAVVQFGLGAGARVDQAARALVLETWSRQAWLQAMQVLISSRAAGARLVDPVRVGQQRPRHRHHVGAARRRGCASATSGMLMRLVATSGSATCGLSLAVTPANAARGTEVAMVGTRASCQPMPVLMMVAPAASIALRLQHDLVPGRAAVDQVEHRQPVDDDEVGAARPRGCGARSRPRSACACPASPPQASVALVGARRRELVDEVAFRAHHLDAVVAGLARELARSRRRP